MNHKELITYSQPGSFVSESFRTLRANLQFLGAGDQMKTVMLAGDSFGEGASFITANLAIVFAQAGMRVIIVDSDLRKPRQHLLFNVDNQHGLTSVLSGYKTPEDVLNKLSIGGVRLMTTGMLPSNPTELLGGSVMKQLIEHLKREADIVLFDAPPLTVVSDAAVLSKEVDGVLMVIRSRAGSYQNVQKAKEFLINAKARIMGVVLNSARVDEISEDYHTHYVEGAYKEKAIKKNEHKSGKK